jgi:hypothetical protein
MPSLCWNWSKYTLNAGTEKIEAVMGAIAEALARLGYTDILEGKDIGGVRDDFVLAVVYLPVEDRTFFQVIGCGGSGDKAEAEANINEVLEMIGELATGHS